MLVTTSQIPGKIGKSSYCTLFHEKKKIPNSWINFPCFFYRYSDRAHLNLLIPIRNLTQHMDNQQVDIREDIKKLEMELKRIDSDKQGLDKERTGKVEQIKQLQIQVDQALQSKMMTINELSKLSAMKNAEKQSVAQMEVNKKTHEQKLKAAIQLKTQKTQERKTVNSELETLSKDQLDSYESDRASIMQSRDDLQLRMENDQRTLNGLISSVQRDKAELARTKKLVDKAHADYKSFEVKAVDSEQKALNLSNGGD